MQFRKYIYLIFLLFFTFSCKKEEKRYLKVDFAFDTVCSIQIFTEKDEKTVNKILNEVFKKLKELEFVFSATLSESETFKLNSSKINVEIPLSKELYFLLEENLKIAKLTNGHFNPCVGKLTAIWRPLWNMHDKEAVLPTKEKLKHALKYIDFNKIIVSKNDSIIKLEPLWFDFGASAKGYATDCIKEILKTSGITRAIIDLGGNVAVLERKIDESLWKVGIKMPFINEKEKVAGFVNTSNMAVVSSGNYERFFKKDGKIYHHILSSKDGMPIENELVAVTIIAPNALLADILSTSCFALGSKEGSALLTQFDDVSGIFFFKNGDVLQKNGKICPFHILDKNLKLISK